MRVKKKKRSVDMQTVSSPSSSSVSVSANIRRALFSPRSPPVANSKFSSALEASCVSECQKYRDRVPIGCD